MSDEPLSEAERFPLLTERSRALLRRLQQHPHAPRWTYACGDRLDSRGLAQVQAFAARQRAERPCWREGTMPDWVQEYVERCRRDVPFYRERLKGGALPTCNRDDLRREPWAFVPDWADVSELIVYQTSGTMGNCLNLPAHPVAPSSYLPLFETALDAHGVTWHGGDRVALMQVAAQVRTYTFASVSAYLDGAGHAKINLNPQDWTTVDDRLRFVDDIAAPVLTSDPLALEQLAALPVEWRPQAILTSAALLLPAQRDRLMLRFRCPVIDVYSMNETGPIAFARADAAVDEHEILPHNLFVEIMDERGQPLPAGQRGEIVVTGGVNPYAPLVRYRTGDYGALSFRDGVPRLAAIERRRPVLFRSADGAALPSISVTVALFRIPLPFFALHQARDGTLTFRTRCDEATEHQVRQALRDLFGAREPRIEQVPWEEVWRGKPIQYTSDLEDAS